MMNSTRTTVTCTVLAGLCIAIASFTGCAFKHGIFGVDRCADIPCGAVPEPAGTKLCKMQTALTDSALQDRTVMYHSDFVGRTAKLSPAAIDRLARYSDSGFAMNAMWIVEPTADEALNTARVQAVIEQLTLRGISSVNVNLATPAAFGLSGPFAERAAGRVTSGGNRNGGRGSQSSGLGQSNAGLGTGGFQ